MDSYLTGNPFDEDAWGEVDLDITDFELTPQEIAELYVTNRDLFETWKVSRAAPIDVLRIALEAGQHSLGHKRLASYVANSIRSTSRAFEEMAAILVERPDIGEIVL